MLNVVRVREGDEIVLFDGQGREAGARVVKTTRREAEIEILSLEEVDREPRRKLTLACAVPRGPRMDFLVEKCGELGVARLIPMVTDRGVVNPTQRQENHLRRWRRIAIEAAKQSGRTRLTEISGAAPFSAVIDEAPPDTARLIASPEEDAIPLSQFVAGLKEDAPIFALVGPEGGFTPEEVELARGAGCTPLSLGPRILRVETAALALASLLLLTE